MTITLNYWMLIPVAIVYFILGAATVRAFYNWMTDSEKLTIILFWPVSLFIIVTIAMVWGTCAKLIEFSEAGRTQRIGDD